MARPRSKPPARAAERAPISGTHTASPRGPTRWTAGALVAVILGVLAALRTSHPHVAAHPPEPASPDSAIAAMDLETANHNAVRLAQSKQFLESLPYFRREQALLEHPPWGFDYDFGTVLNDAAFEQHARRGLPLQATRGTLARVALVREALHSLDRAEAATERPDDRARVRERRAHILWSWRFGWDGVASYRAALAALPTSSNLAKRLALREEQLRYPGHATDETTDVP